METSTQRLTRTGLLAAAAVALFIFEGLAPRPLPWMKMGLGNLPVVLSLMSYGPLAALAVSVLKLFLGGLLSGTLANPVFLLVLEPACVVGRLCPQRGLWGGLCSAQWGWEFGVL